MEAKVLKEDKFSSDIIVTRTSRIEKKVKTNKIVVEDDPLGNIEDKYSFWFKIKRVIALMLK